MSDQAVRIPLLCLPASTLTALHRALSVDRPAAEAARVARQLGFEAGAAFFAAFEEWLADRGAGDAAARDLDADAFWELLAEFFGSLGWGTLSYERVHPGVASLASSAWAEAEESSSARQPTCHLTTGILADLLRRVAGTDLAVMEVECRSRGDERCRFLLGGSEALGGVYDGLRQGRPVTEVLAQLG